MVQREERLRLHQPRRHARGHLRPPERHRAQQPQQVQEERGPGGARRVRHRAGRQGLRGGECDGAGGRARGRLRLRRQQAQAALRAQQAAARPAGGRRGWRGWRG